MPSKGVDYYFYVSGMAAAIHATAFNSGSVAPDFSLTCSSNPEFQTGNVQIDYVSSLKSLDGSFNWSTNTTPIVAANVIVNPITGSVDGGSLQNMMSTRSVLGPDFAVSYGFYDAGPGIGNLTDQDQIYAYVTPPVANWMGQLAAQYPQVRNAPFCQFALPGAHDAGTFDLTTVQSLLADAQAAAAFLNLIGASILDEIVNLTASQAEIAITNLTVTQKDDTFTMLNLGCRYFDFRPGFAPSQIRVLAPDVYHEHAVVPGYPFRSFLTDVLNWLAQNPTEIVVVGANNQGFDQPGMTPPAQTLASILAQAQRATHSTIAIGTANDLNTSYDDLIAANQRLFLLNQISDWLPAGKFDSYSDAVYATTDPQPIIGALNAMRGGGENDSSYTVLQLQGTSTEAGNAVVISSVVSRSHASSPLMSTKPLFDSNTYPWLSANVAANLSNQFLVVLLNDFVDNALTQRAIAITLQRMGVPSMS